MQKTLIQSECRLALNPQYESHSLYPREAEKVLNADGFGRAKQSISQWPGYAPTPLLELSDLARELDVASLCYKDESSRFDLGSFKPLGGAYAVASLLQKQIGQRQGGRKPDISELLAGKHRHTAIDITVTAATDGNHGRSVAWGARLFGCRCIIFIHETVTNAREHAIADYGAEVIRTPGTFDDAVRKAAETAKAQGWHVIPDTSDGTAIEAPRNVMQGYTLMAAEAIEQLPANRAPTHLFLQAGVGGMAAAACAQFWQTFSEHTPAIVLVEPQTAGCWFDSLSAGHPTAVAGSLESIMAGLTSKAACWYLELKAQQTRKAITKLLVDHHTRLPAGDTNYEAKPQGKQRSIATSNRTTGGNRLYRWRWRLSTRLDRRGPFGA